MMNFKSWSTFSSSSAQVSNDTEEFDPYVIGTAEPDRQDFAEARIAHLLQSGHLPVIPSLPTR